MKFTLIPVILASFFFVGFFGFFESPDLVLPEAIVLADTLNGVDVCFENHVKPLVSARCAPCHIENRAGGVSFTTLKGCAGEINDMIKVTVKGKMPPGKREKLVGPDIALLKAWKEQGFKACTAAQ